MGKIDWKSKLSSRKFWCVLISLIGAIGAAVGLSEGSIEKIVAIIGAFSTMIVYILSEAYIDSRTVEVDVETIIEDGEEEVK